MTYSVLPFVVKRTSSAVNGFAPSLNPCAWIGAPALAGPSPKILHGRVPKIASRFTSIQPAISWTTFNSSSSSVPSARTGMLSNRLPFFATMSASR